MGKLTAALLRGLRTPGKYGDGAGLLLHVVAPDRRYWMFRFERAGRERTMSLGNADLMSLADAREAHRAARVLLDQGVDPLAQREQVKAERSVVTFSKAADAYIDAHKAGWRWRNGEQHWRASVAQYAAPFFGAKPVADVTVEDILRALTPIWTTRSMTAARMRSRLELILDYAKARGWRSGDNPATWRGNLRSLLPPRTKVHTIEHRAALPWREAPALFASLRAAEDGMGALALAFLMLTAARSREVTGCRWEEIDLEQRLWTIPASRTKGHREHRVPLSEPAMDILRHLAGLRTEEPLVFFSAKPGAPLADTTLAAALKRRGQDAITIHGFRSTFRDWAADTGKSGDVAEAALAHVIGNQVARAYQRSDLLDQRRGLMDAWATFLGGGAEIIKLVA
jgi:integrase